jgi:ABC-type Fe3+-hydroxamate transport system substrate-binding protein
LTYRNLVVYLGSQIAPVYLLIHVSKSAGKQNHGERFGGTMAEETAEEKLARLEAENKALKDQIEQRRPGQLRLKISEKGGLSVYGLGRFPVTLYKEQWKRLLDHADEIKTFLQQNEQQLKTKQ